MKRLLLLAALGWSVLAVRAAAPGDLRQDPAWRETFRRLASAQERECAFVERRFFPFRRAPIVLSGIVRLAPGRGLSVEYLKPDSRVVIVDPQGVLLRESGGQRAAPADPRVQAATAALGAVMRFDPDELARDFAWHGSRQGTAWTLLLTPRGPALAAAVGAIVVRGDDGRLTGIDLERSAQQRIEIRLGPPREGVAFSRETLGRYFR
jgi:hypothetical protein